ncbi:MAG: tryptophan synthase subunit alpha [Gammaproteobacteria bacterium]|nr:tryptophan synthase subunit alpha [Gammaproteobacteria bacterium]
MNRLDQTFALLRESKRAALITYITAGDPQPDATVGFMHALVKAGADVLELGVPFSDPMADGPVIQAAHERALVHNISLRDVLAMVKAFREHNQHTPVVLMGYLNPIEVMGYKTFAQAAQVHGVDGVLTVDMPPEEAVKAVAIFREENLAPIFLIAPTSTPARIARIAELGSGFLYYVSLKGVTGAASLDVGAVTEKLALIRQYSDLPLGVGFGIKDAESARQIGRIADALIVGSALIKQIETHLDSPAQAEKAMAHLVSEIRTALNDLAAANAA